MIISSPLLQKPPKRSKSKDDLIALEKRIELWTKGEFMDLLGVGETIHKDLRFVQDKISQGNIS